MAIKTLKTIDKADQRAKKRQQYRQQQTKAIKLYQDEIKERAIATVKANRAGRPTVFNQQVFDDLCEYIANGMSLRRVCSEIKGMPGITTVKEWLANSRELAAQYARARDEQADFYADEVTEIADNVRPERDAVEKAKLQIDTRQWVASKLKPKKYGDKLDLTSDGEQLPTPITALQVNLPGGEARQLPPAQE